MGTIVSAVVSLAWQLALAVASVVEYGAGVCGAAVT